MKSINNLEEWLGHVAGPGYVWYLKRLSANDTQRSGSHQAGPYIPKGVMFTLFPVLNQRELRNPDHFFDLAVDSGPTPHTVRARSVWYNNALHDNPESGRNEIRVTRLGGARSPLLDVENTGALTIFAFSGATERRSADQCRVWVCGSEEERTIEDRWGPIDPGQGMLLNFAGAINLPPAEASCWLDPQDMPAAWLANYPPGEDVVRKAVELMPATDGSADQRLIERRKCEFDIFRSLEEAVELPRVRAGFENLASFVGHANTILQRRKSRSGRSLELHLKAILEEEAFKEGTHFSYQAVSEAGKRPDFLFPSEAAYGDPRFPTSRLRMLAVKTTCRDRWRQILNEANRVAKKHLLTLQEGVSPNQYREMRDAGVQLVVPASVRRAYDKSIRQEVVDLETFINNVRSL